MSTKLYAAFVTYAKANATVDGHTWNQYCALGMSRFQNYLGGWTKAPKLFGPYAVTVAHASGTLNKTASKAPIGAYHFWSIGTAGHVGIDLEGGGTTLGMMGTSALTTTIHAYIGISSVAKYNAHGATYLGWATNYAGGVGKRPKETTSTASTGTTTPAVDPAVRTTVAVGANVRATPTATGKLGTPIAGGKAVKMDGYAVGDKVAGSTTWFHHSTGWSHSSGFTSASITNLANKTPVVPVKPPVTTTPPVVTEPTEPPVSVDPPVESGEPTEPPVTSTDPVDSATPPTDPVKPSDAAVKATIISGITAFVGLIVTVLVTWLNSH